MGFVVAYTSSDRLRAARWRAARCTMAVMPTVLLVDDEPIVREVVARYLRREGFETIEAGDGDTARGLVESARPALVVLDVMMLGMDGLALCRWIRARSDLPVILLTARGEDTDRIVGLELGADDYVPKPFNPRELLARLRAVLRRGAPAGAAGALRFDDVEIDRDARVVRLRGEVRALTGHQYEILRVLAENAGKVLSRAQLMEKVRGQELEAFDRSIDVHVSRIRAAIEDDPKHPRRILTLRGAGYIFTR